jgi:hypothetical protein
MNPLSNKIVLLNAPKGAGKDTIAGALKATWWTNTKAFKTSLYQCAYPLSECEDFDQFYLYCNDRELKDTPSWMFYGKSPRDFLIYVSEVLVKPNFGEEFFGTKSARSIKSAEFEEGVVFADSGFPEEVAPLMKKFGGENIFVVQFTGQGANDFSGDSRNFIEVDGTNTIKMVQTNDGWSPRYFANLIVQEIIKYGRD